MAGVSSGRAYGRRTRNRAEGHSNCSATRRAHGFRLGQREDVGFAGAARHRLGALLRREARMGKLD